MLVLVCSLRGAFIFQLLMNSPKVVNLVDLKQVNYLWAIHDIRIAKK